MLTVSRGALTQDSDEEYIWELHPSKRTQTHLSSVVVKSCEFIEFIMTPEKQELGSSLLPGGWGMRGGFLPVFFFFCLFCFACLFFKYLEAFSDLRFI